LNSRDQVLIRTGKEVSQGEDQARGRGDGTTGNAPVLTRRDGQHPNSEYLVATTVEDSFRVVWRRPGNHEGQKKIGVNGGGIGKAPEGREGTL